MRSKIDYTLLDVVERVREMIVKFLLRIFCSFEYFPNSVKLEIRNHSDGFYYHAFIASRFHLA